MNRTKRIVACTFDVDFTDYLSDTQHDELEHCFPLIQQVLLHFPQIKTTWFVRIDSQLETLFGSATYAFEKHAEKLNWLRSNGHEIGWHHHAYRKNGTLWEQETNEQKVCEDLQKYGRLALKAGLKTARMGWGFHTNKTMETLTALGFETDSSAIPRPQYSWDKVVRDWSVTGQEPYKPAVNDYRQTGTPAHHILEVPISTVVLPLPGDTETGVLRYINPAYHPEVFRRAMQTTTNEKIILIAHPYEFITRPENAHAALAFDIAVLRENLQWLVDEGFLFETISI